MEDFVKKTIEDKQEHEGDKDEVKPEDVNEGIVGYENLLNKIENNKSYVLNKDFYPFKAGDIVKTRTTNKIIEYKKVTNGKAKGSWHSVIGENAIEFLNSIGANDTLAENPEVSSHSDKFDFLFKEGSHNAELVREILSDKLKQYDIDWSSDVGAFVIDTDSDKKVAKIKLMDNNTREIFEANVENGEILINEFEQAVRQTVRESEDVAADYVWRTDEQRERIEKDANPEEKKAFEEVTASVKAEADNTQTEFKTEVSNIGPDASKVVNSFDNFNFNGAKNKNDLISLMNRFYKSLGEKHIENNETVGNMMLFVNDNDPSYLESARKGLEKINDDYAKSKIEELIAKCEEIVRNEQTKEKKDGNIEKNENEFKQKNETAIKPDQLSDQKFDELDQVGLESELKKTMDYLDDIQRNPDPATFAAEFASFGAYKDKIEKKIEGLKSESGTTAGSAQEAIKTGEDEQVEGEIFETMSEEQIGKESRLHVIQYGIDQAIYYLNNAKNIPAEKHSNLSEYVNKLQFRKGQLQKVTESEKFKKISNNIKDLNKPLKTERSSEKEEISNIENSKNTEELENFINKLETSSLHGEKYSFMKNLQDVLKDILMQFMDSENKRIKEDLSVEDLRKLYAGNIENETTKSYIEALLTAIENIKTEQEKGFKIGDKVYVLEEDNKVRGGWVVAKIEGKNIEVKNEKNGQTLNRTFGELASSNNAKLTMEWAVERKKELAEEIKKIKDEADQKGEDLSKNETYQKLTKELEDLLRENIEKAQTAGSMIDSLKKMTELFEKRQTLFENLENDKDVKEVIEKVIEGEKVSDAEKKLYKTRSMARDEVILSKIGVSMAQSSEYYKKSTIGLPHAEQMKILDAQIMRVRLENELYKQLALSIHTTNEKMDQLSPKRKGVASKIVDGILSGAKNVPILKNLVYKSSAFKTKEEKKKDESIKQGAIVGVKNEGEGWKVIKVEGGKVTVEKESKATKNVKEKDLMTWNGIKETGKLNKGNKVRVIRSDGQIDLDWTVEENTSGKILVSKENVKTQKTVKTKDIIIPEKTTESEGIKELAKELNKLKDNELSIENIQANSKNVANLNKMRTKLENKIRQLKASDFEGMDDKTINAVKNVFNNFSFYTKSIEEKNTKEKKATFEEDKKEFNEAIEKHKDMIKNLPDELKDFKVNLISYIEALGKIYHETKYSDEMVEVNSEKDKTKETDDLLKKIFNSNQIKTITESDSAYETLEAIEKVKGELKPNIKDNSVIEACFQTLDRITSDAKINTRIRGYSRDILKQDIEKIENKNAKKYFNAVLKNVDNLIKNHKDTLEKKKKTVSKKKKGK